MPRRAKQADQDRLAETFQYEVEGVVPPHEGEAEVYTLLHEGEDLTPLPNMVVVINLRVHMNKPLPTDDVTALNSRIEDIVAEMVIDLASRLYSFAPDGTAKWEVSYTQE